MTDLFLNPWVAAATFVLDWLIRIGLSLRVVMRRRPVGVSLSWLGVILFLPFVGAVIYLMLGEARIGRYRAAKFAAIGPRSESHLQKLHEHARVDVQTLTPVQRALVQHGQTAYGFPVLAGNHVELMGESTPVFDRIVADIQSARLSIHMLFYIWCDGGQTDRVIEAMLDAVGRGVKCRVAVDSIGSGPFLKGRTCARLREAGVEVVEMLPVGLWRTVFRRQDLRNHRKIVVIDGEIAYTGSMNMADPEVFKVEACVGNWVDIMARVTGPVVETLGVVFLSDWDIETAADFGDFETHGDLHRVAVTGDDAAQVMPSGPGFSEEAIRQTLMTAIYGAQDELLLVTPYFVPDETLMTAIVGAAARGVKVVLVVPKENDSAMVRLASWSQYEDLLRAGVRLMEYRKGLMHTKAIVVDSQVALFGTVNLDMRSLWLNFEVTLAVYDAGVAGQLRQIIAGYLQDCVELELEAWIARPFHNRLIENITRLLGPLL